MLAIPDQQVYSVLYPKILEKTVFKQLESDLIKITCCMNFT